MKTPLYETHVALGAKIVDFAGWEMPLQYVGILEEHRAVREQVGIFDVSHMGRILVQGPDAERFFDYTFTNNILGKKDQQAIYGVLCREDGTAIDDVIVLRHRQDYCSVISNASNRSCVLEHLQHLAKDFKITIEAPFLNEGILAIQGPRSLEIAVTLYPEIEKIGVMECLFVDNLIISKTGYTGEKGIEIFVPYDRLIDIWNSFTSRNVQPIGLGARDTLRLEKGYALYGHELSDSIAPTESISAWSVKLKKNAFLGKESLLSLESSPKKRYQYGIILDEAGIARAEYPVKENEEIIGHVTSGTFSPTLKKSIAIVMVQKKLEPGNKIDVIIRNNPIKATVVQLPFLKGIS